MSAVKQVFAEIDEVLKEDTSYVDDVNAIYQFNINDEEPGVYQLILKGADSYTIEGEEETSDCTLQLAGDDFVKLANGELNGTQAFMSGKLKIKGNMGLALKLQSILASFNKQK
ncbi:MAG TPA: SCP2 sterol-binding domain-containing protein [Pseudogracilibacillus sp.]|nr:SCP2 sterol-binding domain-containing protein [Pseudogracilibacillus sp.]